MHIIYSHPALTLPVSLHSSSFSSSSLHIMHVQRFMGRNPLRKYVGIVWVKRSDTKLLPASLEQVYPGPAHGSTLLLIALFINIFYWWSAIQQILSTKELASSSSGSSHSSSSTASRALQCVDLSASSPNEPRKKTSYFPLYWLVNRDPYIGLL